MTKTQWMLIYLLARAAHAATVTSFSPATDLIGGTVDVLRFGGVHSPATFAAGPGGSAIASSPGSAGFELVVTAGDTFGGTWTLTNTDPSLIFLNRIVGLTIDLTLAGRAVFDNDSSPSTLDSASGIAGVLGTAGIAILGSGELVPWPDPANTGDLFLALSVTFDGGFTAGASSSWQDDTDSIVIPEPGSLGLAAAGLLMVLLYRSEARIERSSTPPAGTAAQR